MELVMANNQLMLIGGIINGAAHSSSDNSVRDLT
jgi:hypothetical protein